MTIEATKWWFDDEYIYMETADKQTWKAKRENVWLADFKVGSLDTTDGEEVTIENTVRYNDIHS